jgi:hypothetical protein
MHAAVADHKRDMPELLIIADRLPGGRRRRRERERP